MACRFFPKSYDYIWTRQLKRNPDKRYKGVFHSWLRRPSKYVLERIREFEPDAVFSTHYYASCIMTYLKRKNGVRVRDYALLTDYMAHPNWETSVLLDRVFVPSEDTIERLIHKGYTSTQIVVSGLPVKECFMEETPKAEAREKCGLPSDGFTVLIMNGGNGVGHSNKLIRRILSVSPDVRVVSVAGRSLSVKSSVDRLAKRLGTDRIVSLGFTDKVHLYMKASDVLVTRAGAGTLNEAVHSGIPIVVREGMIINERENRDLFVRRGMAISLSKGSDIVDVLTGLKDDPDRLAEMRRACVGYRYADAVKKIADTIERIHTEDESESR